MTLTFLCHWKSGEAKPFEDTAKIEWYFLEELKSLKDPPDFLIKEIDYLYNSTTNVWGIRVTDLNLVDHATRTIVHASNLPINSNAFAPCNFVNYQFDPVLAAGLWMFSLTMVIGCWLLAKNAGIILAMIRRW